MTDTATRKQLAVLAYHKIGPPPPHGWDTWHYIPEATFAEQLDLVTHSPWSVINLRTFLGGLSDPASLPNRSVLITFDDGCKSMRRVAYPVLRSLRLCAVCFVPTAYIGRRTTFGSGAEPEEPMCDWEDLQELNRNGVAIQSHGVTHNWLSLQDRDQQRKELVDSKRALEQGLGNRTEVFAYPFSDSGEPCEVTRALLRQAGYRAAFLCGGGPPANDLPLRDPFRIDRLAMYRDTDLAATFACDGRLSA